MPSLISSAVLVTLLGTLVLGNRFFSNEINIAGRTTNKIQVIMDLYYAKLQSSLDRDIYSTLAQGYKIMDEAYRYEFLDSTSEFILEVITGDEGDYPEYGEERTQYVERSNPIHSLKIVGGIYYYNNDSSSSQFHSLRTNGIREKSIVIEGNAIPSFFDSITISYPEERLLNFGDIEIQTEEPYVKYRVAHHLLEKLFFIGFNSTEAISGTLFTADLRETNSSPVKANKILQDVNEAGFVDLAVDQYTGDILFATEKKIFALHKMTYFSKVDRFATSPDGTKLVET